MRRALTSEDRIALLMHGQLGTGFGKLGEGMLRYSQARIVAIVDDTNVGRNSSHVTTVDRDVPIVSTVDEAQGLGAEILIVGIAPPGGKLPPEWEGQLQRALTLGMSLINPLHDTWGDKVQYKDLLGPHNWIWDVRVEPPHLQPGVGAAATLDALRILMVGTDMAVGKMTAGLELQSAARKAGADVQFVATGQVGICITGSGVALDAVRLDYATGAIEREVLSYSGADAIIIEGQGALCHPASTATLALMRGSMPTHLILVHRASQATLRRMPDFSIPRITDFIKLNEDVASACGTFPRAQTLGLALNTADLDDPQAHLAIEETSRETGLPVTDPVRFGCEALVTPLLAAIQNNRK